MFKTLFSSLFAVAMFAMGAIGSWYLTSLRSSEETEKEPETVTESVVRPAAQELTPVATKDAKSMAVPLRGRAMSAEDLFRFSEQNRNFLTALNEKNEFLEKEAARLKLHEKDLESKQAEIEGLLAHNKHTLEESEKVLTQAQQEIQKLTELRDEQAKEQKNNETNGSSEEQTQANVKTMAGILEQMGPEAAAETIKKLANNGNMDFVLQLLNYFEGRDAAKILDATNDTALIADISERFKNFKRPVKKRRR